MPENLIGLAEALNRAAEVIERNGLRKGSFVSPHGGDLLRRPVDMVGAIRMAYGYAPDDEAASHAKAAIRFVSERSELLNGEAPLESGEPDYVEHLAGWNDAPERTAAEVAARLRRVAIDARIAADAAKAVA